MNTVLTRSQKICIILLCMLIHTGMIIMFGVVQSQDHSNNGPIFIVETEREHTENLVSLAAQSAAPNVPSVPPATPQAAAPKAPAAQTPPPAVQSQPTQPPLVAMSGLGGTGTNQSSVATPALPDPIKPVVETPKQPQPEPVAHAHEAQPIDEATFDETLALATQFLALEKSDKKQTEKKEPVEPLQQPKIFTKQEPAQTSEEPAEKKKITLAHITNRVLEQMAQDQSGDEGASGAAGAAMDVRSKRRGAASMQQIMFVNYCKKILSCIVTSYRIHKHNAPRCEQTRMACIKLAITKDGGIYSLAIVQSSGNAALDHFMLALFQDASSSFPPVPTALAAPLELPIFNISGIEQLQSAEYWFIQ